MKQTFWAARVARCNFYGAFWCQDLQ